MAVMGDSGKKKKGGKVFGSLERGLDKVITMLTPSKRRVLRDGPRKIKVYTGVFLPVTCSMSHTNYFNPYSMYVPVLFLQVQYNVTLTSQTNPDQVLNQILSILPEKNVDFTQKG